MTARTCAFACIAAIVALAQAAAAAVPAPWASLDIGTTGAAGSASATNGVFTVKGAGANIWDAADAFQFIEQPLMGDGAITAHIASQAAPNDYAKAGVMIRESLSAASANAAVLLTPAPGAVLQGRTSTGGGTSHLWGPSVTAPYWVRLVRAGNVFTGYTSADDVTWKTFAQYTIAMQSKVYVGLAVTSHQAGALNTAVFDHVTMTGGAPPSDATPPTVPAGLKATAVTATSVALSWTASTDNAGGTGVGGYYIYRNAQTSTPYATVTAGTAFTDSTVNASTTYTYQVAAFDKATPAANVSAASTPAVSVTTPSSAPATWSGGDIGPVGLAGSSSFSGSTFTIKGAGANIWDTADALEFVQQSVGGDGTITARVVSQTRSNDYAKAGVMIRESLAANAANAAVLLTPNPGAVLQGRTSTSAATGHLWGPSVTAPYWVRLVRAGNTFTGYTSVDGAAWTAIGQYTIAMASHAYFGLAVSSHTTSALSTAVFDHVTVTGAAVGIPPSQCSPATFGAIGDGTTDNTTAIQNALDACASQGGGTVELGMSGSKSVYLTGPVRLKSHVHLQIDAGVTVQATNDHSRYVGADINNVYQANEALISAAGATDVGIIGAGIIDGAGGQLQPGGAPSFWTQRTLPRPYLIEFYQCSSVTVSGISLRNAPMWNQAFRFSSTITETGVTVTSPSTGAPNTDGVDIVGSSNVTLSGLTINVGDDDIAVKSGLPVDPTDPKQTGVPRMPATQVTISDSTIGYGRGIVIGSEAVNGVNNVSIENVHFTGTDAGIRIKGGRDRGSNIYAISAKDIVMSGVQRPIILADYYPDIDAPVEPPYLAAAALTATTPYVHDITIQNLSAVGAFGQSIIEGLPEACIRNVTLNNVSIQTKTGSQYLGIGLRHMTGTFTDVTSTPGGSNPPFVVQENVKVATAGKTPAIAATSPQANQTACSAQVFPGP